MEQEAEGSTLLPKCARAYDHLESNRSFAKIVRFFRKVADVLPATRHHPLGWKLPFLAAGAAGPQPGAMAP